MTHVGTFAERRDTERVKSKFLFVLVEEHNLPFIGVATRSAPRM